MFAEIIYFTGIALIVYGLFKWITANDEFFTKRGLPSLKPVFILGNTGGLFLKQYAAFDYIHRLYNQFPNDKIFGLFDFRKPLYFVRDPELIRQMAIKDFDHFEDHRSFLDDNTDRLFGNSLFMLKGSKWRDMRATLSPAFTGSKMRQMFELVSECANDMSNYFLKQVANGETLKYEMKDLFSRYTNDVIASCAFGYKVNSMENKNNEFFVTGKLLVDFGSLKRGIKLFFLRAIPSVMKLLGIEFIEKEVGQFFKSMVLDTMVIREEKKIFRPDMVNLLMNVRKGIAQSGGNDEKPHVDQEGFATVEESHIGKVAVRREWTDDEIVAQCFLFFAAGFDTTSTLLTFATYELALNPDVQNRLYDEIHEMNANLGGKQIDYDVLQKMKYLDQVITEALRKWPPAAMTDRLCVKDYSYDDGAGLKLKIEKGQAFWIPIYGLHHDAKYFPEPEKFNPDRFNDENKKNIVNGTFVPFGTGPRNCIGSRFALMELKAIIYYLLLNFSLEPNEETQIPVKIKKLPFVAIDGGVHLTLKPRAAK